MRRHDIRSRTGDRQSGFALVLAILTLMLLTFLGLTLATTTSSELQIATNYRWGLQAAYNAEAGLEVAKVVLRDTADWSTVLYTPRCTGASPCNGTAAWAPGTTGGTPGTAPVTANDAFGNAPRNYENRDCDTRGNSVGYGAVLGSGGVPMQFIQTTMGQTLNGAFTLWVRRTLQVNSTTGAIQDEGTANTIVLTSEGVAPNVNMGSSRIRANVAVRVLETTTTRTLTVEEGQSCGQQGGQTGSGPTGSGFGGCGALSGLNLGAGGAGTNDATAR